MEFQFNNLTDLLLTFNTEEKCISYFEQQRWKGKITCPHCQHNEKIYRTNRGYLCANKECKRKFTVTVGSYFENSNIKLQKWFAAIYLFTAHKKGVSSCQLARDLGITQKSAWFMLHRIREMFTPKDEIILTGTIEADETLIGGKGSNKRNVQRKNTINPTSHAHKAPVLGVVARGGMLLMKPVKKADKATILPILRATIQQGSIIHTDSAHRYKSLSQDYTHKPVNHERKVFSIGSIHTNTIEGAFSLMKGGIIGIYHQVSEKHLNAYCEEFNYRYNSRLTTDKYRFAKTLTKTEGRLTYNQLIQRNEA